MHHIVVEALINHKMGSNLIITRKKNNDCYWSMVKWVSSQIHHTYSKTIFFSRYFRIFLITLP